jgi:hypothetical protein
MGERNPRPGRRQRRDQKEERGGKISFKKEDEIE